MYINDVEEGGSTVFPRASTENVVATEPPQHAIDMFDKNTMEYNLLFKCHNSLAIPPQQGTAALFYSITPDGRIDPQSLHGACPVTKGTKWGANIWIWNRQRFGEVRTGDPRKLSIKNSMEEPVFITWEGRPNGVLQPGQQYRSNTYEHHRFKARIESEKGKIIQEYTVQSEPLDQLWDIKPQRQLKGDTLNVPSQVKSYMSRGSEL
jgi:prolyl 4-hydroxylase